MKTQPKLLKGGKFVCELKPMEGFPNVLIGKTKEKTFISIDGVMQIIRPPTEEEKANWDKYMMSRLMISKSKPTVFMETLNENP